MDADGNTLPEGSMGEICLRGVTLMQGYWNDPTPPPAPSAGAGSTPATWAT
jgi:fatty-acyl-CoA synthase